MNETWVSGIRKNGTKIGTCDNAFVFGIMNGLTFAAFFDKVDYVSSGEPIQEYMREYNSLRDQGWSPMTEEDVRKTSGVRDGWRITPPDLSTGSTESPLMVTFIV